MDVTASFNYEDDDQLISAHSSENLLNVSVILGFRCVIPAGCLTACMYVCVCLIIWIAFTASTAPSTQCHHTLFFCQELPINSSEGKVKSTINVLNAKFEVSLCL